MRPAALVLIVWAATGCSVPKGAGFSEVRQSVAARIDRQVEWTRETPEDEAVAASVTRLLDGELTVDGAIQIALLNNQQLQAVYEELGVAQAALVQAGLLKNPMFDAAVRLRLTGGPVNPEFSIAQDFLDLLYIPMRKRVASAEFEAAKQRVTGAVLDLAGEVRVAWYQVQAELQLLELERTVLSTAEAAAYAAARLRQAGNITDLELASQEALAAQARLDVAATEAHVVDLRERLNSLMGLWGAQTEWTIAGRLLTSRTQRST
jgi:cobalt-zinc-cadmium efflux system outer membrane protein